MSDRGVLEMEIAKSIRETWNEAICACLLVLENAHLNHDGDDHFSRGAKAGSEAQLRICIAAIEALKREGSDG